MLGPARISSHAAFRSFGRIGTNRMAPEWVIEPHYLSIGNTAADLSSSSTSPATSTKEFLPPREAEALYLRRPLLRIQLTGDGNAAAKANVNGGPEIAARRVTILD